MSVPADLFAGGGEMGAIMRSTDWSKTKLGPVEQWPKSLRTMLGVVLGSRFPMLLWWGPDLLHLYNDAYRPILRDKHPASLAAPAAQVWAEVWDVAGPMARSVQEGGPATWTEDLQLFISSGGMAEETYFTFSYSPVPGDDGRVGGLLNTVQETTSKVQSERQIRMLHDLSARAVDAKSEDEAYRIALEVLSANELDLPFVVLYVLDENADEARLVGARGWKDYPIAARWPFAEVIRTAREVVIDDLAARFGQLPVGRWNARPERAMILPLSRQGQSKPFAFLLAGISPHRPFDDRYQRFFRSTADQVATVIAKVRAYEAEKRLLLLEAAPDPLVIVDPVGCISVVNGQTEKVFGTPRASLIGKPVEMLIPNRFRDRLVSYRMEFAARQQTSPIAPVLDLYGQRGDGSEFPIEISLSPVHTPDGLLVCAAIRDVTERNRFEQMNRQAFELETQNRRIREASRLKSEFLANMSHELRTPLNAILGFSELLHDGEVPPDSPQHREFIEDIIKSGRHLLQLINDVLDLAKVEAGKLDFRPEPVDLEIVVLEVQSIVRTIAVAKHVRIDASIDPELKHGILLDPARLKQILYNFISNALKFTPAGGSVTVRARPHGEEKLLLEVEDTGPGIAPEDIERLFVEFQQLDAGAAKEHSGTGLGLALTRRLAEAQGGSVGVRSTVGKGSVFYVVLPRRRPAAVAHPQILPQPAPPGADQPGSVLVIDDDDASFRLMTAALARLGFPAVGMKSADEALRAMENAPPVAIVLDLLMPGMDGFEFLDRLRGSPATRHTPVLVWTVKDLSTDERARLSRSVQAFARKGHGGIPALLEDLRRFLPARPRKTDG